MDKKKRIVATKEGGGVAMLFQEQREIEFLLSAPNGRWIDR